jgi:hypothetical protein
VKIGKPFVAGWLTVQWLATLVLAAAIPYMFFSDVHGLVTDDFYPPFLIAATIATAGYLFAARALRSWQEGS